MKDTCQILFLLFFLFTIISCDTHYCDEVSRPTDFTETELKKFPISNKLLSTTTSTSVQYKDQNGQLHTFYYIRSKESEFRDDFYNQYCNVKCCQQQKIVTKDFFLVKNFDSTGFLGFRIKKCKALPNVKKPCPDTAHLDAITALIGDTIINGSHFKNVFLLDLSNRNINIDVYRSKSLINIENGVIYFELTNGKKYWQQF